MRDDIKNLMVYLAIGQIYLEMLDNLSETHIWKKETKMLGNRFIKNLEGQLKVLFNGGNLVYGSKVIKIDKMLDEEGEMNFLELQKAFDDAFRHVYENIET
jgi:hypothetical protein